MQNRKMRALASICALYGEQMPKQEIVNAFMHVMKNYDDGLCEKAFGVYFNAGEKYKPRPVDIAQILKELSRTEAMKREALPPPPKKPISPEKMQAIRDALKGFANKGNFMKETA